MSNKKNPPLPADAELTAEELDRVTGGGTASPTLAVATVTRQEEQRKKTDAGILSKDPSDGTKSG